MSQSSVVYVVDDEEQVRKSLRWLIEPLGLTVLTCAGAEEFLAAYDPGRAGCLVLDVRMPAMSGLDLQQLMHARGINLPVIFISGHADVPMSVRAMKGGAFDFLEKPFNGQELVEKVQHAIARDSERRAIAARRAVLRARLGLLSEREREVLDLVLVGQTNKEIAQRLAITVRTVEAHRAKVMDKMHAESPLDLARLVALAENGPA